MVLYSSSRLLKEGRFGLCIQTRSKVQWFGTRSLPQSTELGGRAEPLGAISVNAKDINTLQWGQLEISSPDDGEWKPPPKLFPMSRDPLPSPPLGEQHWMGGCVICSSQESEVRAADERLLNEISSGHQSYLVSL